MTRATESRPWPIPTTTAPPAASMYALPSASQIVEPSARTATGCAGSVERRKTWLTAHKVRASDPLGERLPQWENCSQDQRLEAPHGHIPGNKPARPARPSPLSDRPPAR